MADCGIKKYDKLPAVVGWIDVDYLRWRLYRCDHPYSLHEIPLIGGMLTPPSGKKERRIIIAMLEEARLEVKENGARE